MHQNYPAESWNCTIIPDHAGCHQLQATDSCQRARPSVQAASGQLADWGYIDRSVLRCCGIGLFLFGSHLLSFLYHSLWYLRPLTLWTCCSQCLCFPRCSQLAHWSSYLSFQNTFADSGSPFCTCFFTLRPESVVAGSAESARSFEPAVLFLLIVSVNNLIGRSFCLEDIWVATFEIDFWLN